jgi:hypothetical protein
MVARSLRNCFGDASASLEVFVRPIKKVAVLLSLSSIAVVGSSWLAVACGGSSGDDSTLIPDEAGSESSSPDGNVNPTPDTDSGLDGSLVAEGGCGPEGSACSVNGSVDGLCKAGACTACVDLTDDGACQTAYGSGTPASVQICNKGVCVQGDCHGNSDCTGGKICGLGIPNTCGSCTSDSACKTSYGADYVCNTTTGGCETNAVACTNADAGACTGNAADICCVPSAGAAGACSPGNCCTSAQCGAATPTCVNHTCTGCAAVADGIYWVDPTVTAADDASATGNKTDPKCAFRSITHALAAIGNAPAAAVTIKIVAGTTQIGALESFPLIVPTNVTIQSADTAAPVTVQVPAGKQGFVLGSPTSGLEYLTIDGQANTALDGVVAQTGSSPTTTTLKHVKIKSFAGAGIVVGNAPGKTTGGGLAIGPGVSSTGNGTAAAVASGLQVHENGIVVVTGAAGDETHFDQNTEAGIRVDDAAQLTLTGTVGATPPASGTVTADANASAGLLIGQTPGTVPVNVVTGLTAWNTTAGAGIRVLGGSALKLRASSALGNSTDGVHVRSFVSGITVTNDTSKIDLGASAAADPGKNVLQAPAGASPNAGVGICLEIQPNVGQILNAYGNTLVTAGNAGNPPVSIDCATTAGQVKRNTGNGACAGGVALGVIGNAVNTDQIVALVCTQ